MFTNIRKFCTIVIRMNAEREDRSRQEKREVGSTKIYFNRHGAAWVAEEPRESQPREQQKSITFSLGTKGFEREQTTNREEENAN